MSRFYRITQNPVNVYKKAESLCDIDKNQVALETIGEFLANRANKTWTKDHEPLIKLFVRICVNDRKGSMLKEGLMLYRNIAQTTNPKSFGNAVSTMFTLTESKIKAARKNAAKLLAQNALRTEAVLMNQSRYKSDEERISEHVVLPWIFFMWECYRMALDTMQNNAQLHVLYHNVTKKAHRFLLENKRKRDFRSLCNITSKHFNNIIRVANADPSTLKYWQKTSSVKLTNQNISLQLETRFNQLRTAAALKMWVQVIVTITDISSVMDQLPEDVPAYVMSKYYGILTDVMWKANNKLLHAYCMLEDFMLRKRNMKNFDSTEMATKLILASLCIPPSEKGTMFANSALVGKKNAQMADHLFLSTAAPSRKAILENLKKHRIDREVQPELLPLFALLNDKFNPFDMIKRLGTILDIIKSNDALKRYLNAMRRLVVTALMRQLANVYETVKLSKFMDMIDGLDISVNDVEMAAVQASSGRLFSVYVDHQTNALHFTGRGADDHSVRAQLVRLSRRLGVALKAISEKASDLSMGRSTMPTKMDTVIKSRLFQDVKNEAPTVHGLMLGRKDMIQRMKDDMQKRELAQQQQAEEERRKAEEERKKEEDARLKAEREAREAEQKEREVRESKRAEIVKAAREVLGPDATIASDMTMERVEELKKKAIEDVRKQRMDKRNKMRLKARNIDFEIRALRVAEKPVLESHFEEEVERSNEQHEIQFEAFVKDSMKKFEKSKAKKEKWGPLSMYLDAFTDTLKKQRLEIEARLSRKRVRVRDAEAKQREEMERIRKEEEKERQMRLKAEEEARLRAEEEEARLEKARLEEEEEARRRKAAAEEEAKTRANAQQQQRQSTQKYVPRKYQPPSSRTNSRFDRENRNTEPYRPRMRNNFNGDRRSTFGDRNDRDSQRQSSNDRFGRRSQPASSSSFRDFKRGSDDANGRSETSSSSSSGGKWRPSGRWTAKKQ